MFRKYRNEILIALAALAIAAAWDPIRMRFPFDDTYITFRYAANLAHGFGIVWNPGGAHTEGYTNFLFMLMLAAFSWMGCDLVVVSQAIGVVAVVVSAMAIYRIVDSGKWIVESDLLSQSSQLSVLRFPLSTFAVALFLLDPFIWFNAYSGMETSLFTMWLLLAVASVGRRWAPFMFAALAALTRPEGAIMGGVIFLVMAFIQRTQVTEGTQGPLLNLWSVVRSALYCFVIPLILYALWKLWYFGDLLPNSFYIKVAQGSGTTFLPGRGSMRIFYEGVWYLVILAIVAVWKLRKNTTIQIAALWCVMLSGFYLFSHLIQPQYGRFTNSIEVMLIMLATAGMSRIKFFAKQPVLFGIILIALQMAWSLTFRAGIGYMTQDTIYTDRYRNLATVFRSIPNHEQITLASSDAGILPYYSGIRHIDVVGLNTTAIANCRTVDEVINIIITARPDMIFIPMNTSSVSSFAGGHGLIGSVYSTLQAKALASGYKCIAVIPMVVYDLDLFADTLSPHYRDIVNTIVPSIVGDQRIGHDSDFLAPARCVK